MNKKYGIAAIIACAVIVGVLAFVYSNNASPTNSAGNSQQPNSPNSITASPPANATGRHFFAGVNETVTITSNP